MLEKPEVLHGEDSSFPICPAAAPLILRCSYLSCHRHVCIFSLVSLGRFVFMYTCERVSASFDRDSYLGWCGGASFPFGGVAKDCLVCYGFSLFPQHVHPYLYQQNAALLCRGTLQQRVFTLVRVESGGRRDAATAEDEKAEQAHTPADSVLSLEEIGKLLESSRTKFLAGGSLSVIT